MNYFSEMVPEIAYLFEPIAKAEEAANPLQQGKTVTHSYSSGKGQKENDSLHAFSTLMFEGFPVRDAEINGVIWWVVQDVCDALEILGASGAVRGFP